VITTYLVLKIVHLLGMAAWFGASSTTPGDIKRTLIAGRPHTVLLVQRVDRVARFTVGAAILTVLSGLALVFTVGGFARVPPRIHAGLGLTLLLFALGAATAHPTWKRIKAGLARGDEPASLLPLARRFMILFNVEQAMKLVILVLMVWR